MTAFNANGEVENGSYIISQSSAVPDPDPDPTVPTPTTAPVLAVYSPMRATGINLYSKLL